MKAVCGLTWGPILEHLSEDTGTADQLRNSTTWQLHIVQRRGCNGKTNFGLKAEEWQAPFKLSFVFSQSGHHSLKKSKQTAFFKLKIDKIMTIWRRYSSILFHKSTAVVLPEIPYVFHT